MPSLFRLRSLFKATPVESVEPPLVEFDQILPLPADTELAAKLQISLDLPRLGIFVGGTDGLADSAARSLIQGLHQEFPTAQVLLFGTPDDFQLPQVWTVPTADRYLSLIQVAVATQGASADFRSDLAARGKPLLNGNDPRKFHASLTALFKNDNSLREASNYARLGAIDARHHANQPNQPNPAAPPRGIRTHTRGIGLLVAGHDLRFIEPLFPYFRKSGISVSVDRWSGHNIHQERKSRQLLRGADVVLAEWCLGNAVWYGQHLRPGQSLLTRVHSQELRLPYLEQSLAAPADRYIFVSRLLQQAAIVQRGVPLDLTCYIPNHVQTDSLWQKKLPSAKKTIGFVGMVPRSKRLDLALDLLEIVQARDPEYRLIIKGKRPEEYPWLTKRPAEMLYYEQQLSRIKALNQRNPGSVEVADYQDDLTDWYRQVGVALSVSDFESFHYTVADGAASGAFPVVYFWPGSDLAYPRHWLWPTLELAADAILNRGPSDEWAGTNRQWIQDRYSRDKIAHQLVACVRESAQSARVKTQKEK